MCLFRNSYDIRQTDPKTRHIWAGGNLCLAVSLSLTLFAEGFGHRHPALFDGMRVLLMLLAINLLFWSRRRARGCAPRAGSDPASYLSWEVRYDSG